MKQYDYESYVDNALRNVVKEILQDVSINGFIEEQHFFISFKTQHPDVTMPGYLYDEYPEEITIVLQHQFFGLKVHQDHFEVMLTFKSNPEKIVVPFEAMTEFVDPSQRFCLKFNMEEDQQQKAVAGAPASKSSSSAPKKPTTPKGGDNNVVTLDAFRK
jgi:uncharacterized protein